MSNDLMETTRRVAGEVLGISDVGDPNQARAALLATLPDCEFSPASTIREAAAILGALTKDSGPRPALDSMVESRLTLEVDAFADAYWSIAPPARREQWEELTRKCYQFPRLAGRIGTLDRGLDVQLPDQFAEPTETALAKAVAELYPLKPAIRAARRPHLLREIGSREQLRAAAQSLNRSNSQIARIDRGLLGSLSQTRSVEPSIRPRPRAPEVRTESAPASTTNYRWLWIMVPIALVAGSGLLRNLSRDSKTPPYQPIPRSSYTTATRSVDYSALAGSGLKFGASKTTTAENVPTDGLSSAQVGLLLHLEVRTVPSVTQGEALAKEFIRLAHVSDSDSPYPRVSAQDWQSHLQNVMSAERRSVLAKLSNPALTVEEIQLLLLRYVLAGNKGPTPERRP